MPDISSTDPARCVTPDSLFEATCASELIASLNDMLAAAGYDISVVYRRSHFGVRSGGGDRQWLLDEKIREVLTGRSAPTPGIIQRIVTACGGTLGDHQAWAAYATPILNRMRARGHAQVKPPTPGTQPDQTQEVHGGG